jgi:ADP-heptose:LPS heptosyltransferase
MYALRGVSMSFERRLKRRLMAAIGWLMSSHHDVPDWGSRRHRVLFLRYDRIGDMVMSTGTIKAIAQSHATITVDVLASASNASVLNGDPYVGTVIVVNKKRPWSYVEALARIRRERYDAIIDPMVLKPSFTTALLMWFSGVRHRIGVAGRGNDSLWTLPVAPVPGAKHYIDRSNALAAAFGVQVQPPPSRTGQASNTISAAPYRPELYLSDDERERGRSCWLEAYPVSAGRVASPRLVVNVSAGNPVRYWPEDRFVAALRDIRLRHPQLAILVVGTPADSERMARIASGAGVPIAQTPSYRQMMAIVAAGDLVFTADTSITHIASAYSKPSLVMFVGDGASGFGPYDTPGVVIAAQPPSLETLEVEPVTRALEELVAMASAASIPRPRFASSTRMEPEPRAPKAPSAPNTAGRESHGRGSVNRAER